MQSLESRSIPEPLKTFDIETLPDSLQERLKKTDPKYFKMSENELRDELAAHQADNLFRYEAFSRCCVQIRISFWDEYELAAQEGRKMSIRNIYSNLDFLYERFDKHPAFLPWIVTPLAGYLLERKEIEYMSHERLFEILSKSAVDKVTGKVDSRHAANIIRIYELIQNRIYGAPTQRINSEQRNVNVNLSGKVSDTVITDTAELDKRIREIQAKREALQNPSRTIQIDQEKLISGRSTQDKE